MCKWLFHLRFDLKTIFYSYIIYYSYQKSNIVIEKKRNPKIVWKNEIIVLFMLFYFSNLLYISKIFFKYTNFIKPNFILYSFTFILFFFSFLFRPQLISPFLSSSSIPFHSNLFILFFGFEYFKLSLMITYILTKRKIVRSNKKRLWRW